MNFFEKYSNAIIYFSCGVIFTLLFKSVLWFLIFACLAFAITSLIYSEQNHSTKPKKSTSQKSSKNTDKIQEAEISETKK
ncbi:MAG: hypothetical protein WAV68_02565 [Candidatus Nanogingivalis sp.]